MDYFAWKAEMGHVRLPEGLEGRLRSHLEDFRLSAAQFTGLVASLGSLQRAGASCGARLLDSLNATLYR